MSRFARRVDDNHAEIVRYLRGRGATVSSLAAVGNGVPDLLVGYAGYTVLCEVKDGRKPASGRKLTDAQKTWWRSWSGGRLCVIRTHSDAVELMD